MMIDGILASKLRGLVELLTNPLFLSFVLAAFLIMWLFKSNRDKASRRMGWIGLLVWVLLYMLNTAWLPRAMMSHLEQRYAQVTHINPSVHWVVVLGGGTNKSAQLPAADALSSASLKRALEGLRVYRKLPEARLILSGKGVADVDDAVATRMNAFMAWLGVPKAHRVVEVESINTADEARIVRSLVGDAPFYLVTSASHMPRSMGLFEKQGLHPIPVPCDYHAYPSRGQVSAGMFVPHASSMVMFNVALHEYLGILWSLVRGQVGASVLTG